MDHFWVKLLPGFIARKLEGRLTLQKIAGNTGWLFADKIIRMCVGLFVGVWVARYLGPAQFGIFNYALAFTTLFAPFAGLGLDAIVVRDIVRNPGCRDETLGSAFHLKLAGGLFTLLLTTTTIFLIHPEDRLSFILVTIIAAGTIFQAFDVIDFWFQSQVLSKFTVIARDAVFLLMSVVRIVLIIQQASLIAFALASLVETFLCSVGLIIASKIHRDELRLGMFNFARAKILLSESWPLILSGLAILIYMRIDQLMLGEMIGDSSVGQYSAALRISEVWYFIPMAVVSSVFPSIVKLKHEDNAAYYQQLGKLFRFLAYIAYSIAIPTSLLAHYLVPILYGEIYSAAANILSIHIWASVFVFIGVGQSPWNVTEGLLKLSLHRTLCGAIVNILLNLFLIPRYEGTGAAVATLISYATSSFLMNAFNERTRIIFKLQMKALLLKRT